MAFCGMLWAQNKCQLLSVLGSALQLRRAYLCSINLVETSMHNCVGHVTEKGRGGKMTEKEKVKKNKMKGGGGEERGVEKEMMMEEEKV
jgi:hypothetical protein